MIFNTLRISPDPRQLSLNSLFLNFNIKFFSLITSLFLYIWFAVPLSAVEASYGMYRTDQPSANVIGPQFVRDELLDDNSIRGSTDDRHLDYTLPTNVDELRLFLNRHTEKALEEFGSRQKDGGKILFTIFEQYFQIPPKDRLFSKYKFYLVPHHSKLKHALEFILWAPYLTALRTSAKLGYLPAVRILAHNSFLFIEYNAEKEASPLPEDQENLKEFLKNQPIDDLGRSAFFTPRGAKLLYDFFFTYFAYPRDSREFLHPSPAHSVEELKTKEPGRLLRNRNFVRAGVLIRTSEIEEHFKLCKLALLTAAWLHHPHAQSYVDQNPDFFPDNRKPYPFVNSFVDLQTDKALLISLKDKYLEDKCLTSARYVLQKLISLCLNDLTPLPAMLVEMNSFFQSTQMIEGFLTSEPPTSIPERIDPLLDSSRFAEIDKLEPLCALIKEYKTLLNKELECRRQVREDSTRLYDAGRGEYSEDLSKKIAYYTDFKSRYLFYFQVFGDNVPLEDFRLASERFFEAAQDLVVTAQQVSVPDQKAFESLKTELYRLGTEFTKRVFTFYGDEQPPKLVLEEYLRFAKRYSDALRAISQDKDLKTYAWHLVKSNLEAYLALRAQAQAEHSAMEQYQLYTLFRTLGDHWDGLPSNDGERLKLYASAFDYLEEYLQESKTIDDMREAAEAYLAAARTLTICTNAKAVKDYCKKSTYYVDAIMSDPIAKRDLNYFPQAQKMLLEAMTLGQTELLFVEECFSALAKYVESWVDNLEREAVLAGSSVRVDPSNYTTAYDCMLFMAGLIKHNPMLELDCYFGALHYFIKSLSNPLGLTEKEREQIYNRCFDFGDRVTDPLGKARLYKRGMEELETLFKTQEQLCSREELLGLYQQCLNRAHTSRIPQPSLELYWKIIRYMAEAAKAAAFCADTSTMLKWCQGVLEYSQELAYLFPFPLYAPQELYILKEVAQDIVCIHNTGPLQKDESSVRQSVLLKKIHHIVISDMNLKKLSDKKPSTLYPNLPSYLKKATGLLDGLPRKARGSATNTSHSTDQPPKKRKEGDQSFLAGIAKTLKETAAGMKLQALDQTRNDTDLEKVDLLSRAGIFYEKGIGVLAPFESAADCKNAYIVYMRLYELITKEILPNFLTQVRQAAQLSSAIHEAMKGNDTNLQEALLISKRIAKIMNQFLITLTEHDPMDGFGFELDTFDKITPTLEGLQEEYKDLYDQALSIDVAASEVQSRFHQLTSADLPTKLKTARKMAATYSAKTVDHIAWKPQGMSGEEHAYSKAFFFQILSLRHAQKDKNIWKMFDQARRYLINSIECPHNRPEHSTVSPKSYLQKACEFRDEAIFICPFDGEGELIEKRSNLVHLYVFYTYLCAEVTQIWVDSLGENSFLKNFETAAEAHLNAYHALRKANKAQFSAYSKNRSDKERLRFLDLYVMNLKKKLDVQWVLNDAKGDFLAYAGMYLEAASNKGKDTSDLIELSKCTYDTANCRRDRADRFALLQKGCDYSSAFLNAYEENAAQSLDPRLLIHKDGKTFREICRFLTEIYLEASKCAPDVTDSQEALYKIVTHLKHVGIVLLPDRKVGWDDLTFYEIIKRILLRFSQESDGYEATPKDNSPTPNMDPPTRLNSPRDPTSPRDSSPRHSLSPRHNVKGTNIRAAEELRQKLEAEKSKRLAREKNYGPSLSASSPLGNDKSTRQRSSSIAEASLNSGGELHLLLPQAKLGKGASKVPQVALSQIKSRPNKSSTAPTSPIHADRSLPVTPRTPKTPKTADGTPRTQETLFPHPHQPPRPSTEAVAAAQVSRSNSSKANWPTRSQDNLEGLTTLGKIVESVKRLTKPDIIISPTIVDNKRNVKSRRDQSKNSSPNESQSRKTSPRIPEVSSKDSITTNVRRHDETSKFKDG